MMPPQRMASLENRLPEGARLAGQQLPDPKIWQPETPVEKSGNAV
ncbi:hypothetical protein ABID47_001230 [Paenibacillus favisporus]|uniref:Uncharacterized protein n=1 Tax=Paenibacillus favisporus TaxID=221028 RepID=A0ABV2EYC2_9BACL